MTAPDVRTAAQAEAERYKHGLIAGCNGMQFDVADVKRKAFVEGAVWGAALVTPTRETLVSKLYEAMCDFPTRGIDPSRSWTLQEAEEYADAVLVLLARRAAGESYEA